jgi:hypothetical protein
LKRAGCGSTVQQVLNTAVTKFQPLLRSTLADICLTTTLETGNRIPRKIDPEIWYIMGELSDETGVPRPALLRACLKLLERHVKGIKST